MDKLKLEPTAALIMLWSSRLYSEEPTIKFINQLDLSSGRTLYDKCHSVCSWYDQIILNRKSYIKHLIEQELMTAKQKYQLVFLAAGKSPLSIEILMRYSSKVHRIIEVDVSGMDEKTRLYLKIFPEFRQQLKCLDADITSPDIITILSRPEAGFRYDLPTIVLMEGISYYLAKPDLQNIVSRFRTGMECVFIIEYLVPYHLITQTRRPVAKEIFRIIREVCGLEDITSYTREEFRTLFLANEGGLLAGYSMVEMELARTGDNTLFKKPSDGWIECVVGKSGKNSSPGDRVP